MKRPARSVRPWVVKSNSGIRNRERDPFYHNQAWRKVRDLFLQINPLCAECQKKGRLTPAKVADHITPKDICRDPYDISNLQPLCFKCHAEKSAKDKTYFK